MLLRNKFKCNPFSFLLFSFLFFSFLSFFFSSLPNCLTFLMKKRGECPLIAFFLRNKICPTFSLITSEQYKKAKVRDVKIGHLIGKPLSWVLDNEENVEFRYFMTKIINHSSYEWKGAIQTPLSNFSLPPFFPLSFLLKVHLPNGSLKTIQVNRTFFPLLFFFSSFSSLLFSFSLPPSLLLFSFSSLLFLPFSSLLFFFFLFFLSSLRFFSFFSSLTSFSFWLFSALI